MARIVQVELPNEVPDEEIQLLMTMLSNLGRHVAKGHGNQSVTVKQGQFYTSL